MNNRLFSLGIAALTAVSVGTVANAGSAEAAKLTGQAAYSGIGEGLFSDVTGILASDGSITFSSPNYVGLTAQTGGFASLTTGSIINSLSPIPGIFNPGQLFLDFGASLPELSDGLNAFFVTEASDYEISSDGGTGSSIAISLMGFFTGDTVSETSKGVVDLNFTSLQSVSDVEAILLNGGTGSIESAFSGMAAATVPEPATMLGLSLVAGAGFLASRRKQVEA